MMNSLEYEEILTGEIVSISSGECGDGVTVHYGRDEPLRGAA